MTKIIKLLETKLVLIFFAVIALAGGLIFMSYTLTGGAIGSDVGFNILSVIGTLLIICSVILFVYSLKKKK